MADRGGYIGRNPGDSAVIIAQQTYEPTGVQTNFTFTSGYTVGYMDVYFNGVKLIGGGTDYSASDGSTVGLTTYADNGDVLQLIAFKAFNVGNVTDATGNFSVGGNLTITGTTNLAAGSSVSYATTAFGLEGSATSAGALTVSDTTESTSTTTGALIVSGGVGIAKSLTVGEGISIAGTITYNDVTNIDSVGVVTAGKGFRATTGGLIVTAGVSTFGADLVGKDGVQGIIVGTGLSVAGVVTATSFTGSGANLTGISTAAVPGINTERHSVFNTVNISGIATALEFRGDGSQLTGVGGETDITSCLFI